jgi:2'-5' RNA ligase
MRLFVALDIDEPIRKRLATFVEGVHGFASDARWVKAESLHVTLKFIGEWPNDSVNVVEQSLSNISGEPIELRFHNYGFFPTEKAARVFWVGIAGGAPLANLATQVDDALSGLGIPKETRAFSPHLTLARGAGGSGAPGWRKGDRPNSGFRRLQEKLAAMNDLEFGTMTAREFFLYQSQLSPKGSRYTKIARFQLGSSQTGQP